MRTQGVRRTIARLGGPTVAGLVPRRRAVGVLLATIICTWGAPSYAQEWPGQTYPGLPSYYWGHFSPWYGGLCQYWGPGADLGNPNCATSFHLGLHRAYELDRIAERLEAGASYHVANQAEYKVELGPLSYLVRGPTVTLREHLATVNQSRCVNSYVTRR